MSSNRYFKPYSSNSFKPYIGRWINLDTQLGSFHGMVERVSDDAVLLKMPKSTMPKLTSVSGKDSEIGHAGYGFDHNCYPQPYRVCGSWGWWWFPIIIIIFIPFFFW